jgi:hypothetical protein
LVIDQVFEPVTALRCGGQAEPVPRGYAAQDAEECAGGDVVAFVHNDESVAGGDVLDVVAAGKRRQQRDVEDARGFRTPATDLTACETQVAADPVAPLIGQGLAIDQDQGRGSS